MATTYTFAVTRDDIITYALRAIGVLGRTQTPAVQDITIAAMSLNLIVKQWMAKGLTLWKIQENVVHLLASTNSYLMGPSATQVFTVAGVALTVRPLRVVDQGNFIRLNAGTATPLDTPITLLARNEFETYGSKQSLGVVNSFFYDPQLTNGVLYVYPEPSDTTRELHLFCQMPYADFNLSTDNPDFPQEWYQALGIALARDLLLIYGADSDTEKRIELRYREYVTDSLNFSQDEASVYFTYDSRNR